MFAVGLYPIRLAWAPPASVITRIDLSWSLLAGGKALSGGGEACLPMLL
jgi:hypothetical protein